jgi:hypothetical protein
MKNCNHCKIEKLFTKFYKNKRKKDGYADWCKECNLEYSNKRDVFIKKCFASMKHSNKQKRNWNKETSWHQLSLNRDEFLNLINEYINKNGFVCQATGVELTTFINGDRKKQCITNLSIDRLDPKIGYNKNNILFVSWEFNKKKKDIGLKECFTILKLYKERYPERYQNIKQEFKELFI